MTTQTQHTPGPWRIYDNRDGVGVTPVHEAADVADCSGHDPRRSRHEERANARLIAAAPELLASLSELVNSPNAKANAMWDRARAAIARAEGR